MQPGSDHWSPGGAGSDPGPAGNAQPDETVAFSVADERAAARLRHRIRLLLGCWHLRELADGVADLLAVAVLAATPHPRRRADVRLRVRDGVLRGEVRGDHRFPLESPRGVVALEGGLATVLAARADRWGCDASDAGSLVWFEVYLPRHPDGASGRAARRAVPDGGDGSERAAGEAPERQEQPHPGSQDRRRAQPPPVLLPPDEESRASRRRRLLRGPFGVPAPRGPF